MDRWNNWQVLCLETLSDAEDLCMIGLLMGFLFFGFGIALTYRKIGRTVSKLVCDRLKELDQRMTQIEELYRNLYELNRTNAVQTVSQIGELLDEDRTRTLRTRTDWLFMIRTTCEDQQMD